MKNFEGWWTWYVSWILWTFRDQMSLICHLFASFYLLPGNACRSFPLSSHWHIRSFSHTGLFRVGLSITSWKDRSALTSCFCLYDMPEFCSFGFCQCDLLTAEGWYQCLLSILQYTYKPYQYPCKINAFKTLFPYPRVFCTPAVFIYDLLQCCVLGLPLPLDHFYQPLYWFFREAADVTCRDKPIHFILYFWCFSQLPAWEQSILFSFGSATF